MPRGSVRSSGPPVCPYWIDLTVGRGTLHLELGGRLASESAGPLRVVLGSMHRLGAPVRVSTAGVDAVAPCGLTPLFDDVRARRAASLLPLLMVDYSPAVRGVLTWAGVPCVPVWGAAACTAWAHATRPSHPAHAAVRRAHLQLVSGRSSEGSVDR